MQLKRGGEVGRVFFERREGREDGGKDDFEISLMLWRRVEGEVEGRVK